MRTGSRRAAIWDAASLTARWAAAITLFFVVVQQWLPVPLGVVLEGVAVGSLTALVAFGLGLVYRTNGIVNFAQADLGVVPMIVFTVLVLDRRWTWWWAMGAALVAAVVVGVVVERVVVRWFRRSPRLVLSIATIGLAQVLAGAGSAVPEYRAFVDARFQTGSGLPAGFGTFLPPFDGRWVVGPMVFDANHVVAVVAGLGAGVALVIVLRFTAIGLAVRGCADRAERAALLGIPVPWLHAGVWAVGASLAAVSAILRAGVYGLPTESLFGPSFLLRALAVVVLGRMERFGVMLASALALGIVEQAMFWNYSSTRLVDPILAGILAVALLVRRRPEPPGEQWRGIPLVRPIQRRLAEALPAARWVGWAVAVAAAAVALLLPLVLDAGHLFIGTVVVALAITAISLVVLVGWAGEVTLAQMTSVAVGAVVATRLSADHGLDPVLTLLAAAAVGAAVGRLLGLVARRVRGLHLAVLTLGLAVATPNWLLDPDVFGFLPSPYRVYRPRVAALRHVSLVDDRAFAYFALVVLAAVLWLARGMQRGRTGRLLVAARENERSAQSFGVDTRRARLTAWTASGALAAVAGAVIALHQQLVPPELFVPLQSVEVLTMTVVGGAGSLAGALTGTVFVSSARWFAGLVPETFRSWFVSAGTGGGLLLVLMLLPGGLASATASLRDSAVHRLVRRRPSEEAVATEEIVPAALSPTQRRGALQLHDIRAGYGAVPVLFGLDLEVGPGEIVALLGTNGSGKSTLLGVASGIVRSTGTRRFAGHDLRLVPVHRIARLGLVQLPGGRGVFPSLTVAENLRLAGWMHRRDREEVRRRVTALRARFPVLAEAATRQASQLSGGEQQQLAVAMVLLTRPRLLMIDELSIGLGPTVVSDLVAAVRELRDSGVPVLLVEQSVRTALELADRAYFLEQGTVRFHGPVAALLDRPDLLRSVFLAGAAPSSPPGATPGAGKVALEVRSTSVSFGGVQALDDLSLRVGEGEVVGIIGANGAGKTTLFDVISGFLAPDAGTVHLGGIDVTGRAPQARAAAGLARSFQDAKLFGALTTHQAISVACERQLGRPSALADALHVTDTVTAARAVAARADELIDSFGLGAHRDTFVAALSTGTRRVVDLACQLASRPTVVLLDEPSAGLAQRETEALAGILLDLRARTGASLVVIEHDLPLVARIADRLVALDRGRIVAEGAPADVLRHPDVMEAYVGRPEPSTTTRQELYDEARRRGIKGRSTMSKDELVAALARTGGR